MDASRIEQMQEYIKSGKDAYSVLGLAEPPPDATLFQIKDKIRVLRETATGEEKQEINKLSDLIARNNDAALKYNELRKRYKNIDTREETFNKHIEEREREQKRNPNPQTEKEREREKERDRIFEEERLEYERLLKEEKEQLRVWVNRVRADEIEWRNRKRKMTSSYIVAIILSIVGAFVFFISDTENAFTFIIVIILPWVLVVILNVIFMGGTRQNIVSWAIIALFIMGTAVWALATAAAALDILLSLDSTGDPMGNLIGSACLTVACFLPIKPIHRASISLNMGSDLSVDVVEAKKNLIMAFGEK